ncbi:acyltransferase family protein [Sphingopyxis sp. JAI128]|uniref:acyltransferase family protein n=1 Tax=Sphingopyxis sp. JAI128 TaxID=2723066 RepID=UPI00162297AC|nr:acyltransferase [Sphingopyxis sp. JAI128]MBB6427188.1 fucose 4-O-acetylase-like acetyltransferase [Sphingopyxis sp. JAI128]
MPLEATGVGAPHAIADSPARDTRAARLQWVDALKGAGILLVVLGHALGGLIDAGFAPGTTWFRPLFAAIYIFHMPLFFFLTGLFVAKRVNDNPDRFRAQLFSQIAWPYFLWSAVQIVAITMAGSLANNPGGPLGPSLLRTFFMPSAQFWFLYSLFFFHGLSLIARRAIATPFYLLLLIAAGSLGEQQALPGIVEASLQMAPYYGLGVFLGPLLLDRAPSPRDRVWLWSVPLACAALAVTMAHAIELGIPGLWPETGAAIILDVRSFDNFYAALAAIIALVSLARFTGQWAPGWLISCGRQTMPIFLLHILFIAATRIAVLKYDPAVPAPILLSLLCLVGVLMPLVTAAIADRVGLSKWIGFR